MKYIFLLLTMLLWLSACIEPFAPDLRGEADDVYVIMGEVTDSAGYQYVTVSKAAVIEAPEYLPAEGCYLTIEDNEGNLFSMDEYAPGEYRVWISQAYLEPGKAYRLRLETQTGDAIMSFFDQMPSGAEFESLYYAREEVKDDATGITSPGIRFYVDFNILKTNCRYYRWSIEETWEYHSPYAIEYYYDGSRHTVFPPDSSLMVCWSTRWIGKIFTLSTTNLSSRSIKGMRLHFVDNTTTKLYEGYSVLVRQHALSDSARKYWDQMRINSETGGGLYEKQPLPVAGNLKHITNPHKKVLGYFGASSVSEKRLFLPGIRDIGIYYDAVCSYYPLGVFGWREFPRSSYPIYFFIPGEGLRVLDKDCVDCRVLGGLLVKPDFWPQ